MCPPGLYCKLLDEKSPDQGGDCMAAISEGYWEDWSPQCGSRLTECPKPLKCTQRANTKCGPESGCPGECTLTNENGRRACLSILTGRCPVGFHCKLFDNQKRERGGECYEGICPEGEATCWYFWILVYTSNDCCRRSKRVGKLRSRDPKESNHTCYNANGNGWWQINTNLWDCTRAETNFTREGVIINKTQKNSYSKKILYIY
jgi:hypothetical protein